MINTRNSGEVCRGLLSGRRRGLLPLSRGIRDVRIRDAVFGDPRKWKEVNILIGVEQEEVMGRGPMKFVAGLSCSVSWDL